MELWVGSTTSYVLLIILGRTTFTDCLGLVPMMIQCGMDHARAIATPRAIITIEKERTTGASWSSRPWTRMAIVIWLTSSETGRLKT
ncbi:hypothetical protein BDW59DRAFT_149810 [Aspergillus cavernicola]|uniref:Secreted protein n=1 Tax=Aspergillus cavernicola TaxID=176166 RepID=A0ABR4I223_9EURO